MCARLILSTLLALVTLATSVAAPPATRRWTDCTGKFAVEAEYVETRQDSVVLRKASGSTVTVPLARLSDADRDYLKTLAKPGAESSKKGDGTQPNLTFPDAVTEPPSWNDANTPFDLAEFLKAPPAEENAASLYLEAFYEFSPMEMIDIVFPDLPQEGQKRRWEANRPIRQEGWRLEEAWEKDPKSVDPAAVDAWLANFDVGFEKLAAAQQRPKCMFQTGYSFHTLTLQIDAASQVARVVQWRTRRDLARGDLQRPLQDLKMQLRLNRDLRVRGFGTTQLVAIRLDNICCEQVRMILNAPGIDIGHCDRLLGLLAEHEAKTIDALVEGNRADYIVCRQALHDLQHRTGTFDPEFMRDELAVDGDVTSPLACFKFITDLSGNDPKVLAKVARLKDKLLPGAWSGGKMLSDEDYAREVDAMNRHLGSILALVDQPDFRRTPDADLKAAVAPTYEPLRETTLAVFLEQSSIQIAMMQAILRGEARLRGTQCLVALKRWQLEHAEAPPDLETLVKAAGMPRVPTDPYSDQPLHMATIDDKLAIYSIGPDGKDDNAKIEWEPGTREPGDFIFRLETPSQ